MLVPSSPPIADSSLDGPLPDGPLPDGPLPDGPLPDGPLLVPRRTCWRLARAERVGVAFDAENYFTFAKSAMRQARHSIYLLAWDFDGRARLRPGEKHPGRPDRMGNFLSWLAATRPGLNVHVLKWDYAELFDVMRYQRPMWLRNRLSHPRLHLRLDSHHPTGACHHQKLLVIDDALAFCGGIDITANRWDTRAHRAHEPQRRQPDGAPYEPFHDLMMVVDGDAARSLGELARARWRAATGEALEPPPRLPAPWPSGLAPFLRDHDVGIARTMPALDDRPLVAEVERLYRDAIAAAKRHIYLESQYFTSTAVADALSARLAEPDGPEVVVVNPVRTPSWLESEVMTASRTRLARQLREADRHGRFRLYAALTDGGRCITVHAKVMVVDDRILRIGSANLSNRSMGFDTECDLAVEAVPGRADEAGVRASIARTHHDLVSEHLGTTPDVMADALARHDGSLIGAIESLAGLRGRTLEPLHDPEPSAIAGVVAHAQVFDPDHQVFGTEDSVARGRLTDSMVPSRIPQRRYRLRLTIAVVGLMALFLVWRFTGLEQWVAPGAVAAALEGLRADPLGPVAVAGLFVAGGLVMFPVLVMIAATVMLYGPLDGVLIAGIGTLASAAVLFGLGRRLGRSALQRLGGVAVERAERALARHGVLTVAVVRSVPVAPFTLVSLAAGASGVRFSDYIIGTVAGLVPGMLAMALLGGQLRSAFADPGWGNIAAAGAIAVVAIALGWIAGRSAAILRARKRTRQGEP